MHCIKCGKETHDYHFRVLQVQTLHVRDLTGEKRVQALGEFEEYDVCASCAEEKYRKHTDTRAALQKGCIPYAILLILGMVLFVVFRGGEGVFRLLALGMMVCGVLGLWGSVRSINAKKQELAVLSQEKALYRAPKKNDINDITYIPVDEETLARKNGDLMILYELLPEIAIEVHKRIHSQ